MVNQRFDSNHHWSNLGNLGQMEMGIILAFSWLFIYGLALWFVKKGWDKLPTLSQKKEPETTFSVVIAMRNEEASIMQLLESVDSIQYPKHLWEVILVDDASTDDSYEKVQRWKKDSNLNLTSLHLESHLGKKGALAQGISKASKDWIITTDADVILPNQWLQEFNTFILSKNPSVVVGPVKLDEGQNPFSQWQQYEFLSLVVAAGSGIGWKMPQMANGANLAFLKSTFLQIGGYETHKHIPSGDDEFLMHQVWQLDPSKVGYLKSKDAVVTAQPSVSWNAFMNQRLRWSSKWESYTLHYPKVWAVAVFFLMFFWSVSCVGFAIVGDWRSLILIFIGKMVVDLWWYRDFIGFFRITWKPLSLVVLSFTYPWYVVFFAIWGRRRKFSWKSIQYKM